MKLLTRLSLLLALTFLVSMLQAQPAEQESTINATPLCVTLAKAILAAPDDFAELRGEETSKFVSTAC